LDFDTFTIKKEAVVNCDAYLINNKLDEDEEVFYLNLSNLSTMKLKSTIFLILI
jgi:hypothetical protein